ncbi:hypothetical protein ALI22I_00480 [Saccharothrix sp. ALI-22-I]|nr:hypothetical protein ALI22I_00480 [Saccharothrix sp. ALI-22-I]
MMRGAALGHWSAMRPHTSVGLLLNSAFVGISTVALPLALAERGTGKAGIAAFFVVAAVGSAVLNLSIGRRLLARGSPRWGIALCAAAAAVGMSMMCVPLPPQLTYPIALAIACNTVNYPQYMAIAAEHAESASRIGAARVICVLGYLAGLGLFSVATQARDATGISGLPLYAAVVVAVASALCAWLPREARPTRPPGGGGSARSNRRRSGVVVLVCFAAALLLLRSVDSLRQVYLPLYGYSLHLAPSTISAFFALTAVVEILVLVPVGIVADRLGNQRSFLVLSVLGGVSFLPLVAELNLPWLFLSQALYALFIAGFQSIGIVLMGEVLGSGAGGGALSYVVLAQAGTTLGVVMPIFAPGYTGSVFTAAVICCLISAALLLLGIRRDRRVGGEERRSVGGAACPQSC